MTTRHAEVELESYRLANYVVQVPCYVCEGGNTFDAEYCRHCFAPMALAHQATSQNLEPQMVATLGAASSGKTVYLGMLLDILSRPNDDLQLMARGAFSISLQQQTVSALAQCRFPDKTPNEPDRWNWVHCQAKSARRRRPVDMMIPDMAGDALLEEMNHPHSYPVIRSFLKKCAGLLVLVDATRLESGDQDQNFFAMKLLTYITELDAESKRKKPRPLALVLTKTDECPAAMHDPVEYVRRHASGLWQHCQQGFPKHQFFAVSVAGACAYHRRWGDDLVRVPLRVEPRGVVEPFHWILSQLKG